MGFGSVSAQEIPSGGTSLLAEGNLSASGFYSGSGNVATREIVAVTGQSFSEAARVATLNPTGNFYASAMTFTSSQVVNEDDVVLLRFFARMIETTDESGTATMTVYVEGPDFTKSATVRINASLSWKEYFIPFESAGTYALGQLGFKFGFGATGRPQVMEVGGVEAWTYGKTKTLAEMPRTSFDYAGRAADAPWRAQAAARIDQYRKGNYTVRVEDTEGNPVDGASVRVRMVKHAFEFGTAMVAARIMDNTSADNATYRQKLLELFNSGTFENDTKWPAWLGQFGSSFNPAQTVEALKWTQQKGLAMRGHVLVWPSVRNLPDAVGDLVTANDPSVPGVILAHIEDVMSTTSGYFEDWDVINEPYDNFDVMEKYGYDLMAEWFKAARLQGPEVGLFLNDYGILSGGGLNIDKQDAYANSVTRIKVDGGPITGIAFQGHFSGTPTGITKVWEILQRYSTEFPELDMRITEFDITGDDEELKADFLQDFYTIAFSHPKMLGVQMWGFWENAHWKKDSALYNADWSERLIGKAYRELVHEEWVTNDIGVSGVDGQVTGRGFNGDYVVEDLAGRRLGEFTLTSESSDVTTVVMAAPGSDTSRIVNMSVRSVSGTGANALNVGMVVGGTGSKGLLVRVVGPTLGALGVPGVVSDPRLQLYRSEGGNNAEVADNDNWGSGATLSTLFSSLGAFALDSNLDAALSTSLATGVYPVVVDTKGESGVVLVEAYDTEAVTNGTARFVNVSARSQVGTGGDVLVAGFVIGGTGTKTLLIRGVGATLGDFGVPDILQDPQLVVRNSADNSIVAQNDNWNSDAAISSTSQTLGAFALSSNDDAAVLVTLPPGVYTATVSGVNNTTGIALVEVYEVP